MRTERRLTQEEAAELLGVCPRSFRRYADRYQEGGLEGRADRRMAQVSGWSAPVDEVVRLEVPYRERYAGWSVAHFQERCREKHGGAGYVIVFTTCLAGAVPSVTSILRSARYTRHRASARRGVGKTHLAIAAAESATAP